MKYNLPNKLFGDSVIVEPCMCPDKDALLFDHFFTVMAVLVLELL